VKVYCFEHFGGEEEGFIVLIEGLIIIIMAVVMIIMVPENAPRIS